eukprot:872032-Prorocentrum_minimum.AAC.1
MLFMDRTVSVQSMYSQCTVSGSPAAAVAESGHDAVHGPVLVAQVGGGQQSGPHVGDPHCQPVVEAHPPLMHRAAERGHAADVLGDHEGHVDGVKLLH